MTPLPQAFLDTPIAHRALHDRSAGRPENSVGAIRAAVAAGYGIEIDVQLSSDGRAMVFHDDTLDRLTGATGPVRARTADELCGIRLTDAPDGIPTLAQVLGIVDGAVPLLIEIKDQDGAMGPDIGVLEQACAQDLADYGGPVALMSFNPHSVRTLAQLCPQRPVGLTTCNAAPEEFPRCSDAARASLAGIQLADDIDLAFISHDRTDLASPRVAALKKRGLPVLCWTIRSPEQEAQARKFADNITFEGYAA